MPKDTQDMPRDALDLNKKQFQMAERMRAEGASEDEIQDAQDTLAADFYAYAAQKEELKAPKKTAAQDPAEPKDPDAAKPEDAAVGEEEGPRVPRDFDADYPPGFDQEFEASLADEGVDFDTWLDKQDDSSLRDAFGDDAEPAIYELARRFQEETWDVEVDEAGGPKMVRIQQFGLDLGAHLAAGFNQPVDMTEAPDWNAAGTSLLDTDLNLRFMLEEYGVVARYNMISKGVDIDIPGYEPSATNASNSALGKISSMCARNGLPRKDVKMHLSTIADEDRYNPVAEWISDGPWDGIDRFEDLVDSLDPHDRPLAWILLRRFLIGAAQSVLLPESKVRPMEGMLGLQGAQGKGKSTWVKRLLPPQMREFFKGQFYLAIGTKDIEKQALSHFIVELAEVEATIKASGHHKLRAFVNQTRDDIRLPYAVTESKFPRMTSFIFTANGKRHLSDPDGNRRMWVIQPGKRIRPYHRIDMHQLWKQVSTWVEDGEVNHLNTAELKMLAESNRRFEEIDPVEEMLDETFDWSVEPSGEKSHRMTLIQVAVAIGLDPKSMDRSRATTNRISALLTERGLVFRKSGSDRFFDMPPRRR